MSLVKDHEHLVFTQPSWAWGACYLALVEASKTYVVDGGGDFKRLASRWIVGARRKTRRAMLGLHERRVSGRTTAVYERRERTGKDLNLLRKLLARRHAHRESEVLRQAQASEGFDNLTRKLCGAPEDHAVVAYHLARGFGSKQTAELTGIPYQRVRVICAALASRLGMKDPGGPTTSHWNRKKTVRGNKLTITQVREIKKRLAAAPQRRCGIGVVLAKEFGVGVAVISAIKKGRLWAHVDAP